MKRALALAYGICVYLFFLGTFLYTIAFVRNFAVPKRIDTGTTSSTSVALSINTLLLAVFALQHSVMARQGFKKWWTKIVPKPVERATFVLSATIALAELLWQWRAIPSIVWDLRGTTAGVVLIGVFVSGWSILLLSTFLVNHFELFGLEQVWSYFRGHEPKAPSFKTPGLYRLVRHPIYLGFVIGFWATPVMTWGHLLFAVACTGYILVGIAFEERDLIAAYGRAYRDYRRRVPMLIPFRKPTKSPQTTGAGTAVQPVLYEELTFEEIINRMNA